MSESFDSFYCSSCNKSFKTKSDYIIHSTRSILSPTCSYCKQKFQDPSFLKRHEETCSLKYEVLYNKTKEDLNILQISYKKIEDIESKYNNLQIEYINKETEIQHLTTKIKELEKTNIQLQSYNTIYKHYYEEHTKPLP